MDTDAVQRAQRGDRDAYEQLARSSARRLFAVASRILRDTDSAEDAVQQTLVAMWRDLPTLRDPDRFDAWVYRLLVRACASEGRRQRRAGVAFVDLSDAIPARGDDFADVAMRDELGRAFDALSLEHRTVVVLHHFAGLPLADVAQILGLPYGTVGSRLSRALQAMRASIEASERTALTGGQPA